jgi:catalase (peroxidase I)
MTTGRQPATGGRPDSFREIELTGTPNQVEWAEQIRLTVAREFDRVANAFRERMNGQTALDRAETSAVIAIVERKRAETMANTQAGYFIRDWQELSDQVRRMIWQDPGYQDIKDRRESRHRGQQR